MEATDVTEPPLYAVEAAIMEALKSPCAKSKRGVAIFRRGCIGIHFGLVSWAHNAPPDGMCFAAEAEADASVTEMMAADCRKDCGKRCIHAEEAAIIHAAGMLADPTGKVAAASWGACDAVHVKVVDGKLVAGGGPSCWQCSRLVAGVELGGFWLYEAGPLDCPDEDCVGGDGCPMPPWPRWRRYTAAEFHRATLKACGLV